MFGGAYEYIDGICLNTLHFSLREREAAMTGKPGNGKRLTGSLLGYRGKGAPDSETIDALQNKYSVAVEAGGLPPEVRLKLERMRALATKALRGEENKLEKSEIAKAFDEVLDIASELAPILHFKVTDVDWDK
jgi:hypothetical protein